MPIDELTTYELIIGVSPLYDVMVARLFTLHDTRNERTMLLFTDRLKTRVSSRQIR